MSVAAAAVAPVTASPSSRNAELTNVSLAHSCEVAARDPDYVRAQTSDEDRAFLASHSVSSFAHIAAAFERFATRPLLLTRQPKQPYTAITFGEAWKRIQLIASAFTHRIVTSEAKPAGPMVSAGSLVGIIGFTSPDWVVAHYSVQYVGGATVPLQTGLQPDDLAYMINLAQLTAIIVSERMVDAVRAVLPQCPSITSVVVMDREASASGSPSSLLEVSLTELETLGSRSATVEPSTVSLDSLRALVFTSGSTGRPKAAMFLERQWHLLVSRQRASNFNQFPFFSLAYLPLNHVAGLLMLASVTTLGGGLYFTQRADMSTLLSDAQAARPTYMTLVPRVCEMLRSEFQAACAKAGVSEADEAGCKRVMAQLRYTILGDRLAYLVVGTAPLAPSLLDFLQQLLQVPVLDHLGQTESCVISVDGRLNRTYISAYKLAPVPELGYTPEDKPFPRGELLIKSSLSVSGYLNNPTATAALFDEEGFLRTGDIVEEREPWYTAYIDRKSNTLKLAQGEFVAVARLESHFLAQSRHIAQLFLYGSSTQSCLLAVAVPSPSVRVALGERADDDAAVRELLLADLQRVGAATHLQSFEIPRAVLLEREPFTLANGLLTESNKPARVKLKTRYEPALTKMYEDINRLAKDALDALKDASLPVVAKVRGAVSAVLGVAVSEELVSSGSVSFVSMGGDSLSAVRLTGLLRSACGRAPPVGLVLDGATSLAKLVAFMEASTDVPARWSFDSVHGEGAKIALASDLTIDQFIPETEASAAKPQPVSNTAQHVLLTGANGFLGRFLLLELLQSFGARGAGGAKVSVVVRAPDAATAKSRLRESYDAELLVELDAFDALGMLAVFAGDLMQPQMGLNDADYEQLASDVDTVIHNGALVNHALSYPDLFDPNVLGTVEIMRFSVHQRLKPITFISTVAVAAGKKDVVTEQDTALNLWDRRTITNDYASGYASSKWAGEVLLEQLASVCGVPVNIIRSSMVLPHTRYEGQLNKQDFITRSVDQRSDAVTEYWLSVCFCVSRTYPAFCLLFRLLIGAVRTGLRPESLYLPREENTPRPHIDGMPGPHTPCRRESKRWSHDQAVSHACESKRDLAFTFFLLIRVVPLVDVSSAGIVAIALQSRASGTLRIFHAMNVHDDGISLDSLLDWTAAAGYPLSTVTPYQRWFDEYGRALEQLPPAVRETTNFPILYQWAKPSGAAGTRCKNDAFSRALQEWTTFKEGVPHLDQMYLEHYLKGMHRQHLI